MSEPNLAALERRLHVTFRDRSLLRHALIHKSYVNERPDAGLTPNERLEFLGDAVLGAVAAHWLFEHFPEATEGDLTMRRAAAVRQSTLADWARSIDLGQFLLLGRGESHGGGRQRETLLARAFEAVIGAVYVDRGYLRTQRLLRRFLESENRQTAGDRPILDAKSRLQQVSQARFDFTPEYEVVEVTGPGHSPAFTVEVIAGANLRALGRGSTKQAAQQAAARAALELIAELGQPDTAEAGVHADQSLEGVRSCS
jgi:ribonuclease-3